MKQLQDSEITELLYHEESTVLDFKSEQYKFETASDDEKSEILKDLLAFANVFRRTDAIIMVGVREIKGGKSLPVGIDKELDDASLQQFVNSKLNKPLSFLYQNRNIEGKKCGSFQIPVQERPFYLKKDYGRLKKETVYIRRGSATAIASIEEVSMMNSFNSNVPNNPILKLLFPNNSDTIEFNIQPYKKMDEGSKNQMLLEYNRKFPYMELNDKNENTSTKELSNELYHNDSQMKSILPDIMKPAITALNSIVEGFENEVYSEVNIERYNKYLEKCYQEYNKYLEKILEYEKLNFGKIELEIDLINEGTYPANDIDIHLHFPDGFMLYDYIECKEIQEPSKPISFVNFVNFSIGETSIFDLKSLVKPEINHSILFQSQNNNRQLPNVSNPKITKTNSYDVDVHIRKCKHHQREHFSKLYVIFDNYEDIISFNIDYSIIADNIPNKIIGELKVIINKKD
jgi:hypothetical protein